MANENKPIKRSPELAPLSRDHHEGLLLCWKIRTGIKQGIEEKRISDYMLHFFRSDLEPHFQEEEKIVFPLLPDDDPLKIEALEQHATLRSMIHSISEKTSDYKELLQSFADRLDVHIRFEERQLFPYIENIVPLEALKQAGAKLDEIHRQEAELVWPDEFWVVQRR